jgi:predicted MFS family arabinose efflux permease
MVDALTWRTTSIWIAIATAVLAVPIALLMRNQPSDINEKPYGADAEYTATKITGDANVMSKALRSADFWLLAITFFVCGATSNGLIGVHFIAHAVEHGFAKEFAASALAFMGVFNFVGTIFSGWLTDRYNPRLLLAVYYTLRGVSLLFLPLVHNELGMGAFAILFGLDYIATVPPTVALTADTFGRRNVGVVYGWIFCAHQIGAASASWFGGAIRDSYDSYNLAFYYWWWRGDSRGDFSTRDSADEASVASELIDFHLSRETIIFTALCHVERPFIKVCCQASLS